MIATRGVWSLILVISISFSANAEPMLAPSLSGLCSSSVVVVGEYLSYEPLSPGSEIGYFSPPLALFRRIETWRGDEGGAEIRVRFDFHDGSPCLEPGGWRFKESLMPKRGSRWVLFLSKDKSGRGYYETFRGDFGRVEFGESVRKLPCSVQSSHGPQEKEDSHLRGRGK